MYSVLGRTGLSEAEKRTGQKHQSRGATDVFGGISAASVPEHDAGTLLGSFLIGAANGIGVPYCISTASAKAGRNAATTVIPALSVALYIAQFTTPAIVTVCEKILGSVIANITSYHVAILLSLLFTLWCVLVVDRKPAK